MLYDGDGRKTLKYDKTKYETKEKFPVWLPSHPLVYEMETGFFLVSENTENKPNLS